jgi:predicted Zn-dependent protease
MHNCVSRFVLAVLVPFLALAQPANEQEASNHARQSYNLTREGRVLEAEAEMRDAIRLSPDNPLYHSALAGLLIEDQKLVDAKAELETALRLTPPEPAQLRLLERLKQVDLLLGAQLAKSGQCRQGMEIAQSAAERFVSDARVFQMLGYFKASAS